MQIVSIVATDEEVLPPQASKEPSADRLIANFLLTDRASKDIIVLIGDCGILTREIVHVSSTGQPVGVHVHGHTSDGSCHFIKGTGDGKCEKETEGVVFQKRDHILLDMLYDARPVFVHSTGTRCG